MRFPIILVNSIAYSLAGPAAHATAWLAQIVIVAALAYGILTLFRDPFRRLEPAVAAWATTLFDFGFIFVWIYATGGFYSPFSPLFYVAVASVALRFNPLATILGAFAYGAGYLGLLAAMGHLAANLVESLVRVSYFGFVAIVSAYIARQYFDEARAKREMREEMRLVQLAEEKFRSLLEAAPDPIVITDDAGTICIVNAQTETLFGRSRVKLLGLPVGALIATGLPMLPDLRRESGPRSAEVVANHASGAAIPMEATSSVLPVAEGVLVMHVLRDLRERKLAEVERLRAIERAAEVERLKEMDAFRTQFINMAAHELGTPLTPIRMQIHILKRGDSDRLSPEQVKSIQILDRNVERLRVLTQDVLDVARIQASSLGIQRKPVDLNKLVAEAIESYAESARHAQVRFVVDLAEACMLEADPKRLTQVLFNLLGNALKFTPPGGAITVKTEQTGNEVRLVVEDTGAGLAPDDVARLFRPFSQVGSPEDRKQGTGLGLFICKGIVESHGGAIEVRSAGRGYGSVFTVRLPTDGPPETAWPPLEPAPVPTQRDSFGERVRELI